MSTKRDQQQQSLCPSDATACSASETTTNETMKCHNGPYLAACADRLGRELTKDEIIHALDCLAHEAISDRGEAHAAILHVLDFGLNAKSRDHLCRVHVKLRDHKSEPNAEL